MDVLSLLSIKSKIGKISNELYLLNQEHDKAERIYKEKKQKLYSQIKQYTEENNIDSYGIKNKFGTFKFVPVVTKKIVWDIDKIKSKVDKKLLKQFVDKEYTINDFDGLVTYLKSCGVNPKMFASYLNVKETVNKKKLDQLSDLGEITEQDIEGCYKIEVNSEYIRISELVEREDEQN